MAMPRGISLRQAAKRIGVHPTTLKHWIEDGEGPRAFIKRGVHRDVIRIMPEQLEAWIDRNSRGSDCLRLERRSARERTA